VPAAGTLLTNHRSPSRLPPQQRLLTLDEVAQKIDDHRIRIDGILAAENDVTGFCAALRNGS
jgi:hypothetical protein